MNTIFVIGDPAAQGSKRMVRLKNGRTVLLEQSKKVKPWREAVAVQAAKQKCPVYVGDVAMYAIVRFARPANQFKANKELKASAPARPGKLDCDKIARSICDALTGIAYADDRQVAVLAIQRVWCNQGELPGATIFLSNAPAEGRVIFEHP